MKKLHTGEILFDSLDILIISLTTGSSLAYLIRKYKGRKSPIVAISIDDKPLKLPVVRGGDQFRALSLRIRNNRLADLLRAIITASRKQKQLKLLQIMFAILNTLLTSSVGLRFAVGGSLDVTQIILIAFPATVAGFILERVVENPLATVILPLAILYGRGIENVPDPSEKCKILCKVAEEFHNKQLKLEMKELHSLVEDTSPALQLPKLPLVDEVPLVCVEEKGSLLQRYQLRQLVESEKARNRVQNFREFIKRFPECDPDPEAVYEHVVEKVRE